MTTKFTQGPWHRGDGEHGDKNYIYCNDATGSAVAVIGGEPLKYAYRSEEDKEANAYLIATAPDLYKSLQELVHIYQVYEHFIQRKDTENAIVMARQILAQARGEL